jgi:putative transposase
VKKNRFTDEQIIGILKEHSAGVRVEDLARKHGVSAWTIYTWRQKYGGMDVTETRRLKQLEDENRKLKRLVADLSLDNIALKDVVSRKW